MNPELEKYLQKFRPAAVDTTALDELREEMRMAVPEIADSVRKREELAAELRIPASRRSQSRQQNQD